MARFEPEERVGMESASSEFELFDLTVSLGPGLIPWISAVSRLGHVHGIPRNDPEIPPLNDLLDSVYDYVDQVRFAEGDPNPEIMRILERLVFGEPSVLELFLTTRGAAVDHGREVLVRVLASPHLAVLPWELLPNPVQHHAKRDGRFLTLAPDASVVRMARGRTYPIRTDRIKPPLNLLLVLSSPIARNPLDSSLAFDIYEEKRSMLAELEPLVEAGLLRIDVEDQPTIENLRKRIGAQRRGYHMFHFLGHAEPDRLILEDEQGRRDDQSGSRFTEILRLCPDLRLAFFAGCETARPDGDPIEVDAGATQGRLFLSLADRCVRESCPVVIGMQAVLPFRTERLFTRFFYQSVVSGYSVAAAMRLARGATRGDRHVGGDLLDWSVPVLFAGSAEPGPLVDRTAEGKPPQPPYRHVLRLGIDQHETRFFARDVALRQTVDILAGRAPERILVVTGPAGVGKTMLIDRALEELDGPVSILYIRFDEVAPALVKQLENIKYPSAPRSRAITGEFESDDEVENEDQLTQSFRALAALDAEAPLEALCTLVAELLARQEGVRSASKRDFTAGEWWARLFEELTSQHFVLVIDNLELLVDIEDALSEITLRVWFARRFNEFQARSDPDERSIVDLLRGLADHVRDSGGFAQLPGTANSFIGGLQELSDWLGGYGRRTRGRIEAATRRLVRDLRRSESVESLLPFLNEDAARVTDPNALETALERVAEIRTIIDQALRMVGQRRSGLRLAVCSTELPDGFLELKTEQRFVMRLGQLTWSETWRWIRRNLPGLLRYGEDSLERFWHRLGPELERWEELERRILAAGHGAPVIEDIVNKLVPHRGGTTRLGGISSRPTRPRGERPLRLAVAGPHIASADALARAITSLAGEHGVGGRVVADEGAESGSLAVLLDVPTVFKDGTAGERQVLDWLGRAADLEPDIILLDYGYKVPLPLPDPNTRERPILQSLRHEFLMIASGGNVDIDAESPPKHVSAPGAYDEVLAVGALSQSGALQPYAEWAPAIRKPDLFMDDQLQGTPLEDALLGHEIQSSDGPFGAGTHGSSFSALRAVCAAVLVWSTDPDLTPDEIKRLLRRAARPLEDFPEPKPLALDIADAVSEARQHRIKRTLRDAPCSLQALAAITGLNPRSVISSLDKLTSGPRPSVRRLHRGRLERFELIDS